MRNYFIIGITIMVGAGALSAEPHTYSGTIVNARCAQAAPIVSRNSRGYVPAGVNTFAGTQHKPINTGRLRKPILRHCAINAGVTEFALLDARGNFFLLDEAGNSEVMKQRIPLAEDAVVGVRGSVDRSTLNVLSLSKAR